MTKKKSAIPSASDMRKLVRKETKKIKPNYGKLISNLKVTPGTKKSAIPNASDMRKIVSRETKKAKPNYGKIASKLMDSIKVTPGTKKSAIPNASDMRKIVSRETKKAKPNYGKIASKLMDSIRVTPTKRMWDKVEADKRKPDSPKKSTYVMSRGGDSKAVTEAKAAMEGRTKAPKRTPDSPKKSTYVMDRGGDSKAVTEAKAAMEGRTKLPAKNQTYVGEPIVVEGEVRKAKSSAVIPKVKPKKKRTSLKESYTGRSEESMDPDKVESQVGTYSDKPIINDTRETVDPEYNQRMNYAAKEMSDAEKDAPNLWTGLAPLAMGAIMGDIGVGASIGGQLMIDEGLRKYKTRTGRETAALKAANSGGNRTPRRIVGPDGKVRYTYDEDKIEGAEAGFSTSDEGLYDRRLSIKNKAARKGDLMRGKDLVEATNNYGHKVFISKITGAKTYPFGTSQPSSVQQIRINKVRDGLHSSVNEKAMDNYDRMSEALKAMKNGNQLAGKNALKQYISESEGGGKLTDFDVEFMQYLFGVKKYKQKAKEFVEGRMNPTLEKELGAQMANALARARRSAQRKYKDAYKAGSANGIKPPTMRRHIGAPDGLFDKVKVRDKITGDVDTINFEDLELLLGTDGVGDIGILGYE